MTDLTFIEEGNPNQIDESIYFGKRLKTAAIISQIESFQRNPYQIDPQEPIYTFLIDLPGLDDDSLYQLSLIREPRDISDISEIL